MTDIRDLVNRAWMHAKCSEAPLYLAGYDSAGASALLSEEPTAYTEQFINRIENATGCAFKRVLLSDHEQLFHEFEAVSNAYAIIEAKNYWSDDDRRRWRDLGMRHSDLRKAIQAMDRDEDSGQFGMGA